MLSEEKPEMKIMEVIRKSDGGMKQHYISLVKGLVMAGHIVYAFCSYSGKDAAELKHAGAEVCCFDFQGEISPLNDIRKIIQLTGMIRRLKPDIVHCHGFKASLICRPAAFFASCSCVYTVHNFVLSGRGNVSRKLIGTLEKLMAGKTAAVITVSNALKDEMVKNMGVDTGKVYVVHNAKPVLNNGNRDKTRKLHGITEKDILVGTVARLVPSKGIDLLIEAMAGIFSAYPDAKLLIAGSGPDEGRLRHIAETSGLNGRIIFAGQISNIEDYYAAFDYFVLPTMSEGLGISVMEAMSAGLPVIASETGGIPELITHMKNGLLVKPGSKDEISKALLLLLQNRNVASEFGRQAAAASSMMFTEEDMVKETIDIFKQVCFK